MVSKGQYIDTFYLHTELYNFVKELNESSFQNFFANCTRLKQSENQETPPSQKSCSQLQRRISALLCYIISENLNLSELIILLIQIDVFEVEGEYYGTFAS